MSEQAKLTDDMTIADELAKDQRQVSVAEFFSKNKQMLGFDSPGKSLVTTIKEAVDNSLDASEEAEILPEISVVVKESGDYYNITIRDNGPGITKEQVPKVFGRLLYGSRFSARRQTRGQQGIGISASVLYAQQTSGKDAKIKSKPKGSDEAFYAELRIDEERNKPEISKEETIDWEHEHGVEIELELEGNMRARKQLHKYIKYTAVVNPHATIYFDEPGIDEPMHFERIVDELPPQPTEIPPHPHGVELGTLMGMIEDSDSYSLNGFLENDFTRVGPTTSGKIKSALIDNLHGRNPAWSVSVDADLKSIVSESVNRKPKNATELFASKIANDIVVNSVVTKTDIHNIVEDASQVVESKTDSVMGDTVVENVVESVWNEISNNKSATFNQWVSDVTSKKSDDTVSKIVEGLTSGWDSISSPFTRKELDSFVEDVVDNVSNDVSDAIGETYMGNITDKIWEHAETVDEEAPSLKEIESNRDYAQSLIEAMRSVSVMSPPTDCLSPIGEENIEAGLKSVFDAEFYSSNTRSASVYGGEPFIAEAGIVYGGELESDDVGKAETLRFANRVPLVYQRGACASTDVIKGIGWRNYKLSQSGGHGLPQEPMVILVHIASTSVPFTSESKDAIANVEEIENEIERAVRGCARELKSHLKEKQRLKKHQKKKNVMGEIIPDMASKLATITGNDTPMVAEPVSQIMNNTFIGWDNELIVKNNQRGTVELEIVAEFTEPISKDDVEYSSGDIVVGDRRNTTIKEAVDNRRVSNDASKFVLWKMEVKGQGNKEKLTVKNGLIGSVVGVSGEQDEKLSIADYMVN